jgi:hypothetical protein
MIKNRGDVSQKLAECVDKAEQFVDERVDMEEEDEGHITSRYSGAIAHEVRNVDLPVHEVGAQEVSWRGTPVEKHLGADFAIGYKYSSDDFVYKGGILVQSKVREKGYDIDEIKEDASKMRTYTPASYICVYSGSSQGFRYYPARAIDSLRDTSHIKEDKDLRTNFHHRSGKSICRQLFLSFIGDEWVFRNLDYIRTGDIDDYTFRDEYTYFRNFEENDFGYLPWALTDGGQRLSEFDEESNGVIIDVTQGQ